MIPATGILPVGARHESHEESNAMMRVARIIWNVILLAFVSFWTWAIIPKVLLQFSDYKHPEKCAFSLQRFMMAGQGVGLLLAFAFGSISLSSLCWQRISAAWRIVFGVVLAAFLIGTFCEMAYEQFYAVSDYCVFLISTSFFLLPPVLLGRGYPELAMMAYLRIRNKNVTPS